MSQPKLRDVEVEAKNHPDTFFVPSLSERSGLGIGDLVQLHFVYDAGDARAERMWVRISATHAGAFQGVLENDPQLIPGLVRGDRVDFEVAHVARILVREGHPLWCENAEEMAFVSRAVLAPSGRAGWVYREEPETDDDSGWRVFVGTEPQSFLDDPANVTRMALGDLIDRDGSLAAVFRGEFGPTAAREGGSGSWSAQDPFVAPAD